MNFKKYCSSGLCGALAIALITTSSCEIGRRDKVAAQLCKQNMLSIWAELYEVGVMRPNFPQSLENLSASKLPPTVFVCPTSGHKSGSMQDIDQWTDYIYLGNQLQVQDSLVAMLVCPPANHGFRFGHVVYLGGNFKTVSDDEIHRLLATPWSHATNVPQEHIDILRSQIVVRVPERFKQDYGNGGKLP